jgi:hypothetical protein
MHYRPYKATLDTATLNEVAETTRGGTNIGSNAFSGVAGRILAPSSQSMGGLMIPYGWDQRRYSVVLEFDVITPFAVERSIITGYTGYDEITATGHLDPNMPIFVNSHTIATATAFKDQMGIRRNAYRSNGAKQVLSGVQYINNTDGSVNTASTPMRPSDALLYKQRQEMCLLNNVVDARSMLGDGYLSSNRDNVIGSKYLSKVCMGYRQAALSNSEYADTDAVIYGDAAEVYGVAESNINKSLLFQRLKALTSYGHNNSITVGELASVWPQIHDDTTKTVIHMTPGLPETTANCNNHWGGAIKETALAYMLCQSVPALMSTLLFSEFSFAMDNKTMDGSVRIALLGMPKFIVPIPDDLHRIQAMESNLVSDVAAQITSSGVTDFDVVMTCRIIGSNQVTISVNGGERIPYSAPAYCDAIYTPVMGESADSLVNLGNDIGYMLHGIFGDSHNRSNIQQPAVAWDDINDTPDIYLGGM